MYVCIYVEGELTGTEQSRTKIGEQLTKKKKTKPEIKTHVIAKLKQNYLCIFLEVVRKRVRACGAVSNITKEK